ncbi:MAG: NIPSNAP family protein [Gemmataceae bacterium]
MKRRSFLKASVATLGAAAVVRAADKPNELYELRTYTVRAGKQPILDRYLRDAFIPAVKRLNAGPVGAFVDVKEDDPRKCVVLVVHPSAESFATLPARLAADAGYRAAAAEYLDAKAADPVYARIETSLLAPIEGMPRMVRPDATKPRLMNLRVYENHNERAAAKKVEMFNTGELAIFRRVGLTPVLFASAVAGPAMPNLTYLLTFPDESGRAGAWSRFRDDAEWKKLRAIPEYADKEIVSKITNTILTPTAYSEI